MTGASPKHAMAAAAPLLGPACALVCGILINHQFAGWPAAAWGLAILAAALLVCAGYRGDSNDPRRLLGILAAFLALGGLLQARGVASLQTLTVATNTASHPPPTIRARGVISEVTTHMPPRAVWDREGLSSTTLAVTAVFDGTRWLPRRGTVLLLVPGIRDDLPMGQPVQVVGRLEPITGPTNPGERDARPFFAAQGIAARLVTDSGAAVTVEASGAGSSWLEGLGHLRESSRRQLEKTINPEVAPLAAALILGRREALDPMTNDAFLRTGTTHLLAISGLHLQVLAVAVGVTCLVLGRGQRATAVIVALVSIGYALLVGLRPSVVRSAAMTTVVCAAAMTGRPLDRASALAAAAIVTLLLSPFHLFDVGCQLSFLAVAALFWVVPLLSNWARSLPIPSVDWPCRRIRWLRPDNPLDALELRLEPWPARWARRAWAWGVEALLISVGVSLATMPLVALRFHVLAPISILLNLPLVPLTSLAMICGGLDLALGALWSPLGIPFGGACGTLLDATLRIVRWGVAVPGGHRFVPGPSAWWVAGFLAALAWAAAARTPRRAPSARLRRRQRAAGSPPALPRSFLAGWGPLGAWCLLGLALPALHRIERAGALEVTVIDVGHGLATAIHGPSGATWLYDCGRMNDPAVGRRLIAPALWSRGVWRVDGILVSHPDLDHINGVHDLLDRFAIGGVWLPPGFLSQPTPELLAWLQPIQTRGIPVRELHRGQSWDLGADARLEILSVLDGPDATRLPDNPRSAVATVSQAGRTLLLTGDLEEPGLSVMLSQPRPSIQALLASHHGSRTGNPGMLAAWLQPAVVLVSQADPRPGTRDALEPLESAGIPVRRTRIEGALTLAWKPAGLVVSGHLAPPTLAGALRPTAPALAGLVPPPVAPWPPRTPVIIAGLVVGLLVFALIAAVEWGAWTLVHPRQRFAASPPPPPPWTPVETRARDGTRLAGEWHPPAGPSTDVVILCHGFAEDRQAMRPRAEPWLAAGWGVLAVDHRARGQSEGRFTSFGRRESDDLARWLDAVPEWLGTPPARVVVWGRSMGAAVAIGAAAADPRIRGLVLEAPYADLVDSIRCWLRAARLPGWLAPLLLQRASALAGADLVHPRPADQATRLQIPALVLHGGNDRITPPAQARALATALRGPVTVVEVPSAGHTDVYEVGRNNADAAITAFARDMPRFTA